MGLNRRRKKQTSVYFNAIRIHISVNVINILLMFVYGVEIFRLEDDYLCLVCGIVAKRNCYNFNEKLLVFSVYFAYREEWPGKYFLRSLRIKIYGAI